MSGKDTSQSAIRSFFTATSRWFETCSRSTMSASEAMAMRDAILAQQWDKTTNPAGRTTERSR